MQVPVDAAPVVSSRGRVLDAVAVVAERRGLTGFVRTNLERAGLPLRPNEYIFLHIAGDGLSQGSLRSSCGAGCWSVRSWLWSFVVAPMLALQIKVERRRKAFEEQLPDVLSLIAGSLRAGWGIQQSIELVVEEIAEPAASEFARVQAETRFGLPLEQALGRMADRLDSEDFRWTVSAINIQREVGGNLAEVLDIVATTIRQRAELRRHVSALTAEGRYSDDSARVCRSSCSGRSSSSTPPTPLLMTSTRVGVCASDGLVLLIIGIVWLNRLTKVEV